MVIWEVAVRYLETGRWVRKTPVTTSSAPDVMIQISNNQTPFMLSVG